MFRGLFPRLFSYFREGGLLYAEFSIGAAGAVTQTAAQAATSHNEVTLTRTNTGAYTIGYPACGRAFVVAQLALLVGAQITNGGQLFVLVVSPSAGTATMVARKVATDNNNTEIANGDVVRVFVYAGQGSP